MFKLDYSNIFVRFISHNRNFALCSLIFTNGWGIFIKILQCKPLIHWIVQDFPHCFWDMGDARLESQLKVKFKIFFFMFLTLGIKVPFSFIQSQVFDSSTILRMSYTSFITWLFSLLVNESLDKICLFYYNKLFVEKKSEEPSLRGKLLTHI